MVMLWTLRDAVWAHPSPRARYCTGAEACFVHLYELQAMRSPPGEAPPSDADPAVEDRFSIVYVGAAPHAKVWLEEGQFLFRVRAENSAGQGTWSMYSRLEVDAVEGGAGVPQPGAG
eukprot:1804842-Pyramimonas_sp.AAC.1